MLKLLYATPGLKNFLYYNHQPTTNLCWWEVHQQWRYKNSIMEKDPVCGMSVDPKSAAGKSDYQGKTYYFCSAGCKKAFDSNPEKYAGSSHSAHTHHH